jgi:transposase
MRRHQISKVKMNIMRRLFIEGRLNTHQVAHDLKISTITSWRYFKEFERIRAEYPERLKDMDFYLPEPVRPHRQTPFYSQLMKVLPGLLATEKAGTKAKPLWRKYHELYPEGYTYFPFKDIYYQWLIDHPGPSAAMLLDEIPVADLEILLHWRHGNDHRRWQISTVLQTALTCSNISFIMGKADCERISVHHWLKAYKSKGLKGFDIAPRKPNKVVAKRMCDRKDKLVKLLHETPKMYGINRTSWTILALWETYQRLYQQEPVSYMQVSASLKQLGYRYKKSRDMLTSQDPNFRTKINRIQAILRKLRPDEKFFSIDEYGPVGIRIKGGRTLKHIGEGPAIIPEKQKSKGFVICIAALELSTNQVTHFYSLKKNTFEMIKLIGLLTDEYKNEETLYLSWDAVSWHNSGILKTYIENHNQDKKPIICLVPLPACSQFLNVIESVFCGLAKAVIHNSDYASVEECKAAIDLHFETRNQYFRVNPKRAGRKIWGKELVKSKFSETQHTRSRNGMRGVSSDE